MKDEKTVIASMRLPKAQKLEMDGYFHEKGLSFSEGLFKFAYYAYTLAKDGLIEISESGEIKETENISIRYMAEVLSRAIKYTEWTESCKKNGEKGRQSRKKNQEKSPEENKYAKYGIVTRK